MTLIEEHEKKFQKLFEEKGENITAFIKLVAIEFALQKFEHRKQKEFIEEFVVKLKTYLPNLMDWISVKDRMPTGNWSKTLTKYSEEVLAANSCAVVFAHYNRELCQWQTGEPANNEWIDKINLWAPSPKNPHD